jgi:predicted lipoprotein
MRGTRRFGQLGVLAALLSCGPVPLGDGERLKVVKALAAGVIAPSFAETDTTAAALTRAAEAFAADPSAANLETMRAAWRTARLAWKRAAPFLFGPGMTLATKDAVDWFPADPKKLDELVAGMDPLTPESIALLGAKVRGFHALELLLFGAAPGLDPAPALAASAPAGARRRNLVVALAADVHAQLVRLRLAWAPEGEDHLGRLTAPAQADSPYPTVKAVLDTIVNEAVTAAETATNRLARPLGLMSGGEPRPELEESAPSDHTLDELVATVVGIRRIVTGPADPGGAPEESETRGIAALVRAKNPALALRLNAVTVAAETAVRAIPRPLRAALLARDPAVMAAYQALREQKRMFSTELVAALGAVLKFNDNDGD